MYCNHTEGDKHDCEYVINRNRLIPMASLRADILAGENDGSATWSWRWDAAFHAAMADLATEL